MASNSHRLSREQIHHGWDNAYRAGAHGRRRATPSSSRRSTPRAGSSRRTARRPTWRRLDFARVNPVTGPVFIDGAEPGDALKVTILRFQPSGWGWTANIPGFGLLADQFPEPALHLWNYDPGTMAPAMFGPGGRVPLQPFPGTIGCAPAEPGPAQHRAAATGRRQHGHRATSPRARSSTCRSRSPGALFSVGDTHAAQGDGEVCGTAIESPMDVALRFELVKGAAPRFAALSLTPRPGHRHLDAKGYEVTTGIGPDLMAGARDAVSEMIDLLARAPRHGSRSTPTCCASSAPTCASARSSTCRTGSSRSTSRAWCSGRACRRKVD